MALLEKRPDAKLVVPQEDDTAVLKSNLRVEGKISTNHPEETREDLGLGPLSIVPDPDASEIINLRADLASGEAGKGAGQVGFKQAGEGAVDRTAAQKMGEVVSIKDYGAKGDGTTDDRPAIQKAIDEVSSAGGGVVMFPYASSFYRISSALVSRSGVTIWVPNNSTRIVCTGDAETPFDKWPKIGCIELGSYAIYNVPRAPSYPIADITGTTQTVTLSTPGDAVEFEPGDIVVVESTDTFEFAPPVDYPIPVWLELNVVEVVDSDGNALVLRHPIEGTHSGVIVRRLTRTGSTELVAGGDDTGVPLFATRDFSLIGGTWEAEHPDAAFSAAGGIIDSLIAPYRVRAPRGVGYGNLYAHCEIKAHDEFLTRTAVELAYGSHDNVVSIGTVSFQTVDPPLSAPIAFVALGEGSKRNRVAIQRLNLGEVSVGVGVLFSSSQYNQVAIRHLIGKDASSSLVLFTRASASEGTAPECVGNMARIDTSIMDSQDRYAQITGTGTRDNKVVDSKFFGTITNANRICVDVVASDNYLELVECENGRFSVSDDSAILDCYAPEAVLFASGSPQFYKGDIINLRSAGTSLARSVQRDFLAVAADSSDPFEETISYPAGVFLRRDRIVIKMQGIATGTNGTKSVWVDWAGLSLPALSIPSGSKAFDLEVVIVFGDSTANTTAFVKGFVDGEAPVIKESTIGSLTPDATSYDVVLNGTVASAGDALTVRGATCQLARPTFNNYALLP